MFRLAILGGAAIAATLFVLSAVPAVGASSATVSAAVTPTAACVTVSPASVDFGTANFSRSDQPFDSNLAGSPLTITNCSQQQETIFVSGTNASNSAGTSTWTLHGAEGQCAAGLDQYALQIFNLFLTTTNQTLFGFVGGGNTFPGVVPNLHMPCNGSNGAGETMNFAINFTASL